MQIASIHKRSHISIFECMLGAVQANVPRQMQIIQNIIEFHAEEIACRN